LSHAPSPFCVGYFWDRVYFWDRCLNDGPSISASSCGVKMGSFEPWVSWFLPFQAARITGLNQTHFAFFFFPSLPTWSRDQEDHGSKPAWANSLWDSILKKSIIKNGW
jgi:hypothetical protein